MVEVVYRKKRRVVTLTEPDNTPIQSKSVQIVKDILNTQNVEIENSEPPKQIHNTPKQAKKIRNKRIKLAKVWLGQTWPDLLGEDQRSDPKLLKVGVHQDVFARF